jgi:hypothetical protein
MLCKYCNCEFTQKHFNQIFCSKKCQTYIHICKYINVCNYCNKEFKGRKERKFCSKSCNAKSRVDHLTRIQNLQRKYPKIEGLDRAQIYRKFNPEKMVYQLDKEKANRVALIQILGGCCVVCNYGADVRALQLDHIYNDGKEDRARIGNRIHRYYLKNVEEACLKIQVLCANCHAIKTAQSEFKTRSIKT